jgi:hypothetical protein
MIYKGAKKGSMDAFGSYTPIGLLMHAFKLVDVVFLEELVEDTKLFLTPAQEGYIANRGARGNILRARMYTTLTLELGMVVVMTLLDYTGAFDAIARSSTDVVLGKSGARRKLRSLHRKIAAAATGRVRTKGLDGAEVKTDPFEMTRGGIQGLGSRAYLFILCLNESLDEDDALGNDLDYAIRRECLRLETLEREEAEGGVVHTRWLAPRTAFSVAQDVERSLGSPRMLHGHLHQLHASSINCMLNRRVYYKMLHLYHIERGNLLQYKLIYSSCMYIVQLY